jgi:hypothetical protein
VLSPVARISTERRSLQPLGVVAVIYPQRRMSTSPDIDSLRSRHSCDEAIDLGPRALPFAALQLRCRSSALLGSYDSLSDSEPQVSSLDENLLDTLVVGRRVGGI